MPPSMVIIILKWEVEKEVCIIDVVEAMTCCLIEIFVMDTTTIGVVVSY